MDLKGRHGIGQRYMSGSSDYVLFMISDMHEGRTVLHHRFFDWFSSNQHKMGGLRVLRKKKGIRDQWSCSQGDMCSS